ncbi:hypothetical protein HOLleu_31734 [Holothuria leucospilota]|uniref:Uncharacterized protein n=1 Tax=Holothuria leucospilota TaxID=206669 RepID=A0A9Q1BIB4_HOLLE|nr:hypothetical protein HOLleu_31734 [Holothuria leucospilota]
MKKEPDVTFNSLRDWTLDMEEANSLHKERLHQKTVVNRSEADDISKTLQTLSTMVQGQTEILQRMQKGQTDLMERVEKLE